MREQTCNIHRVKDVEVYTSKELKKWIIDNRIEIISPADAINGTDLFQQHLKDIDSPLWIGNMQ